MLTVSFSEFDPQLPWRFSVDCKRLQMPADGLLPIRYPIFHVTHVTHAKRAVW
jgi:hypothetical protein